MNDDYHPASPDAPPVVKRSRRKQISKGKWHSVMMMHGYKCHWCGIGLCGDKSKFNFATMDHLIPLSRGGTNQNSNLVPACHACNHKRGNQLPAETKSKIQGGLEQ